MRQGRPTRIMVTFPSAAANDPRLVSDLVDAGMVVARISCAHDEPAIRALAALDAILDRMGEVQTESNLMRHIRSLDSQ